MKLIILIALCVIAGCASSSYRYEVHLVEGGGTHHLITADDENEAWNFVDDQEDSHGAMKIIKVKN